MKLPKFRDFFSRNRIKREYGKIFRVFEQVKCGFVPVREMYYFYIIYDVIMCLNFLLQSTSNFILVVHLAMEDLQIYCMEELQMVHHWFLPLHHHRCLHCSCYLLYSCKFSGFFSCQIIFNIFHSYKSYMLYSMFLL